MFAKHSSRTRHVEYIKTNNETKFAHIINYCNYKSIQNQNHSIPHQIQKQNYIIATTPQQMKSHHHKHQLQKLHTNIHGH